MAISKPRAAPKRFANRIRERSEALVVRWPRHRWQAGGPAVEVGLPHLLNALVAPRLLSAIAIAEYQIRSGFPLSAAVATGCRARSLRPRSAETRWQIGVIDMVLVRHLKCDA